MADLSDLKTLGDAATAEATPTAPVHERKVDGLGPIHWACRLGRMQILQTLPVRLLVPPSVSLGCCTPTQHLDALRRTPSS